MTASASLAQVHRAVTTDGRTVAVKVLRPGVEDDFKRAIETEGPVVVDVRVSREENTFPMIPAGKAAREMVG